MSNLHRIIWIDSQIRAGKYPNCRDIAQQFELSVRQASRDIEYLRYSLGAPVEYCPRNNGYHYRGEAFALPAQYISRQEKDALGYLAWQYGKSGSSVAKQLAQLFSRLSGQHHVAGGKGELAVFPADLRATAAFKCLNEAIGAGRKVEIEYINAGGAASRRIFCPYKLFAARGAGYVVGYCELREDMRILRLDRIGRGKVLHQSFSIPPWFDEAAYSANFDFRTPYRAVVVADTAALSRLGAPSAARRTVVSFTDGDKFLSALLSQAEQFSILSPRWLRQRLRQRLNKLARANFRADTICPTSPGTIETGQSKGGNCMAKKLQAEVGKSWTSYIGCLDTVLRQAGLWEGEICQLMGMTGIAFHFIVHKTACPSSVTVYDDWMAAHGAMMDRIGIHCQIIQAFPQANTFKLQQQEAVAAAKESIDCGVPVITWAPSGLLEFGLITGYDDEDQVFFIQDCINSQPDPLLYTNLGIAEAPVLYVQIVKGRIDVDREKTFLQSLQFGSSQWKKQRHVHPDYANGRKGYANLIATLEREDFDPFGLAYIINVYAEAKHCLARYLQYVDSQSRQLRGLAPAAELMGKVAEKYQALTRLVPFSPGGEREIDRADLPRVLELVRQCLSLEEQAMAVVEQMAVGD